MTRLPGVLGGMGPLASAFFMMRITGLTAANTDQEHLRIVLWSDPHIPDRTLARMNGGPSPFDQMHNGIRILEASGAQAIVIPCNTAHAWYDDLVATSNLPILHIVDALIQELVFRDVNKPASVVGLLGTAATLRMRLYDTPLERNGYRCVSPREDSIHGWITPSINALKAGDMVLALPGLLKGTEALVDAGANTIVLACTELPLIGDRLQASFPSISFSGTQMVLPRAHHTQFFNDFLT
jgi:aspartate racemase